MNFLHFLSEKSSYLLDSFDLLSLPASFLLVKQQMNNIVVGPTKQQQNQQMQKADIEATLRKIDPKFADQLNDKEKERAVEEFKALYAEEMQKAAAELNRRKRVIDNRENLIEKSMTEAREVGEELKTKMQQHEANRLKLQQKRLKEHKIMEENWKRRWEEIARKRRNEERNAFELTIKMRKENEQFFSKKIQAGELNDSREKHEKKRARRHSKPDVFTKIPQSHTSFARAEAQGYSELPELKSRMNHTINHSTLALTKNEEIKSHQERWNRSNQQRQADNFQKFMQKLVKIEQTRLNVQERVDKEVNEAKKIRQAKENPQKLAYNRQKGSRSPAQKHREAEKAGERSMVGKKGLGQSISRHLERKRQISELQFKEREGVFEAKQKRMKEVKIQKLVKEAVHLVKHETLLEE